MLLKFKKFFQHKLSKLHFRHGESPSNTIEKPALPKTASTLYTKLTQIPGNQHIRLGNYKFSSLNKLPGNLAGMIADGQEFLAKHPNLESRIFESLNHSSLPKYLSPELIKASTQIFINGICASESTFGKFPGNPSQDRLDSGPFQIRERFMTETRSPKGYIIRWTKTASQKSLSKFQKYFRIAKSNPTFLLTKQNRTAAIRELKALDPTNISDIPKLIALQFERTLDSCKDELQKPPFNTDPYLRQLIFLIGYKEGQGTAHKAAETISQNAKLFNDSQESSFLKAIKLCLDKGAIPHKCASYILKSLAYNRYLRDKISPTKTSDIKAVQADTSQELEQLKTQISPPTPPPPSKTLTPVDRAPKTPTSPSKVPETPITIKQALSKALPLTKPEPMKLKITRELKKILTTPHKFPLNSYQNISRNQFKSNHKDPKLVLMRKSAMPEELYQKCVHSSLWGYQDGIKYANTMIRADAKILRKNNQPRTPDQYLLVPLNKIRRKYRSQVTS